jgi:hypothetical protein
LFRRHHCFFACRFVRSNFDFHAALLQRRTYRPNLLRMSDVVGTALAINAVIQCDSRSADNCFPCLTQLGLFSGPCLPRWVPNRRVDSQAMLSAFLAFKNTCAPGDFDYLFSFYILEHKNSPVVNVQAATMKNAQTFAVTKVDTPGLCSRPCIASGCARCSSKRGGYIFRWYHPAWGNQYLKIARPGAWVPREDVANDIVHGHRNALRKVAEVGHRGQTSGI